MSDRILETLLKADAPNDVVEEYKKLKIRDSNKMNEPVKPERKCTEKQLAALAAGREKRRKIKLKK